MKSNWRKDPETGLYVCATCKSDPFTVLDVKCSCVEGCSVSADHEPHTSDPSIAVDEGATGLPSASFYEREMLALYFRQRRHEKSYDKLRNEVHEHEWKVGQLILAAARDESAHHDKMRKTLVSLLDAARHREMPEAVERLERLDRARLRNKQASRRATHEAPGAEDAN